MEGQVLADFIAEFTPKNDEKIVYNVENRLWKVFMDDASSAIGPKPGLS